MVFCNVRKTPNDGVNCPAVLPNVTQFYPEKTEQKSRRIPRAEGGSA